MEAPFRFWITRVIAASGHQYAAAPVRFLDCKGAAEMANQTRPSGQFYDVLRILSLLNYSAMSRGTILNQAHGLALDILRQIDGVTPCR